MLDILIVILLLLIFYCLVWIPVGLFNLRMFKEHNGSKAGGLEFLKAFCPFYNICFARKLAYGRSPVFFTGVTITIALIVFRLISVALVTVVPILVFISAMTMWLAILIYLAFYIINAIDFGRMLGAGPVTLLASIIIPPLGYYLLLNQVAVYFYKEEDELSGRFGH